MRCIMREAILKLLIDNEGKYISGEEVSKKLFVSRTAIWKHINNLKEEGYIIESIPRKGYCLLERPDLLSPEEIRIGLDTTRIGKKIITFDSVSSTNDVAKKLAAEGAEEGTIILAEQQLVGRGRMARNWSSLPGLGIWMSVILKPNIIPPRALQLIFVNAVAVCRAIRNYTGLDVTLKWPNDILFQSKKICGILTELSAEIDQINYIIAGIGINVNQEQKDFPWELQDTAISLKGAGNKNIRRIDLLKEIIKELDCKYDIYLKEGFPLILKEWKILNSTLGQEVNITGRNEKYSGTALDLDEDGCLVVKTEDGDVRRVIVGDVTLRKDN